MRRVIAVDFDGTLCSQKWPKIGEPNTELIEQLKEEQERGTALILFTCRSGRMLREAVKWSKDQGLKFDQVNRNLPERIKAYRGDTRKISADLYIDDRNVAFKFGSKLSLTEKSEPDAESKTNGGNDNADEN